MFAQALITIKDKNFRLQTTKIALPMMLQQLITNLVNLLDNLMVGQLGSPAISGVASANKFFLIAQFSIIGLVSATTVFIAQYYGANDSKHLRHSFRFSIVVSLLVLTPFIISGIFFPEKIAAFFNKDPEMIKYAVRYMPLAILSFIPMTISYCYENAMRALGYTKIPLLIGFSAVISNVCFNYILIFGKLGLPALGVLGAALGTMIARTLELLIVAIVMHRIHFPFETKIRHLLKIPKDLVFILIKKSIPLCFNEFAYAGGLAMLFKLYGTRGSNVLTSFAILETTTGLFFVLFSGMSVASIVLISQPLGANQLAKARLHAYTLLIYSFFISIILSLLMAITSFIAPLLFQVSPEIRAMTSFMIQIYALFFWAMTLTCQFFFTLRSGGDMKSTLIMDAGFSWFILIPFLAFLAYKTTLPIAPIFILGESLLILKLFIAYFFFKKETWLNNLTKLTEDKKTL